MCGYYINIAGHENRPGIADDFDFVMINHGRYYFFFYRGRLVEEYQLFPICMVIFHHDIVFLATIFLNDTIQISYIRYDI